MGRGSVEEASEGAVGLMIVDERVFFFLGGGGVGGVGSLEELYIF